MEEYFLEQESRDLVNLSLTITALADNLHTPSSRCHCKGMWAVFIQLECRKSRAWSEQTNQIYIHSCVRPDISA